MPTKSPSLHVVLGAGQVGPLLAAALAARGHEVRVVRRRDAPSGAFAVRSADVRDGRALAEACEGAAVIYDCTNPSAYHRWDEELLPMRAGILEAAVRTGAKLVSLECLYALGADRGAPFAADAALAPSSRKGELRAEVARALEDAAARGDLRYATGRASDFVGDATPHGAVFRPDVLAGIAKGRTVYAIGNPDLPHAYSYVPDVVRGLVALGADDASGVFHLPIAWSGTTRALVRALADEVGAEVAVRGVPGWLLRVVGLAAPQLGAVAEMMYQWDGPLRVDDRAFVERFGFGATPVDVMVRETMAPFRSRPAAAAPSAGREAA